MNDALIYFKEVFSNNKIISIFIIILLLISGTLDGLSFLALFQIILSTTNDDSNNFLIVFFTKIISFFKLDDSIQSYVILILIFVLGKFFFLLISRWYSAKIVADTVHNHQLNLVQKLLKSNPNYIKKKSIGSLTNSLITEIAKTASIFNSFIYLITASIQIIVYFLLTVFISWFFLVIGLIFSLIIIVVGAIFVKKAQVAGNLQTISFKKLSGLFSTFFLNFRYLKMLSPSIVTKILEKNITEFKFFRYNQIFSKSILETIREPLYAISICSLLIVSTNLELFSLSQLIILAIITQRLVANMSIIQNYYTVILSNRTALDSYKSLVKNKSIERFEKKKENLPNKINEIAFKNVYFDYGKKKILKNFNLKIKGNKLLLLKGKSGVGKTTVIDLLLGFIKVKSGSIEINGKKLQKLDIRQLRSRVGMVPQNPFLFNMSIRENICLSKNKKFDKKIWNVLRDSNSEEFVQNLPGKLDYEVGEGGQLLSHGQCQRIAIARAIYSDSKIFVMDEITSSLDNENKRKIVDVIVKLKKSSPIILICHTNEFDSISDYIFELK